MMKALPGTKVPEPATMNPGSRLPACATATVTGRAFGKVPVVGRAYSGLTQVCPSRVASMWNV